MKNNVKMARIKSGLTQQQLAEKVGVTRQTISLIEKETLGMKMSQVIIF